MTILEKAIDLANRAHSGQVDKQGQPYILHPLRVMLKQKSEIARAAAVLHDVVEDTDVTLEQIRTEIDPEVAVIVDHLSRRPGEVYVDFVKRSMEHPVAKAIKIADIHDNLGRLTPELAGMEKRYLRALAILGGTYYAP